MRSLSIGDRLTEVTRQAESGLVPVAGKEFWVLTRKIAHGLNELEGGNISMLTTRLQSGV